MSRQYNRRSFLLLGGSAAVAAVASACTRGSGGSGRGTSAAATSGSASSTPTTTAPSSPTPTPTPTPKLTTAVHVSLLNADGDVRGVGMPIIAFVDQQITDAKAFNAATTVTVNGEPVEGNWYWQSTARGDGSVYEAHWRPEKYWPAHAKIHMDLPVANVLAGKDTEGGNFYFENSLTLDMETGVAYLGRIDASTLQMTVTADGKPFGTYPVSLGAPDTPTARGVKVIMEKGLDIRMTGPGYDDPHVKYTQRLTYGGEYLHSAPWNIGNIGHRSTSNGCTNLLPADAQNLFDTFEIGDVFEYPNADGPAMTVGAGYGDWNVPWSEWQAGGVFKPA
ncbi:L,D-transpeptidase [Jatrophihabitans sp. YIM 134969]